MSEQPMSERLAMLHGQASDTGIDTYATVRQGFIDRRTQALGEADFDTALLLSHGIWWLSVLHGQVE